MTSQLPLSPRGRRALWLGLAVLAAIVPPLLAIWSVDVLPTHDGPKNLYAAHLRFRVHEPEVAAAFAGEHPPTAFGFALIYGPLEAIAGWQRAYQLSWSLLILGTSGAYFALVRALDPRRWPLGILGFAAAMQWVVFMGFVNYLGSLALGLAALAVGLASSSWSLRRELSIGALLLASCAFHPFGAQLAGAGLLFVRLWTVPSGARVRQLGALVLMGMVPLLISLHTADRMEQLGASGMLQGSPLHLSLAESLENFRLCFVPGPAWRAWPLLLLAALGYGAGVADLLLLRRVVAERLALLVIGVAAFVAALLLPFHGLGWQYFSPRFIPVAILLGVASIPLERARPAALQAFAGCALAFNLASNLWAASELVSFRRTWSGAYALLGATHEPGRTLLPIVALPDVISVPERDRRRTIAYASPLLNIGEIYAVDREALSPYGFTWTPGVHLVTVKDQGLPRAPSRDFGALFGQDGDPLARRRELVRVASYGAAYDDVLFVGPSDAVDELLALGYVADARDGGTMLGRFVGCQARVRVTGATGPTTVVASWLLDGRATFVAEHDGPPPEVVELPRSSCDGIWVGVYDAEARCAGANPDGLLFTPTAVDRAPELACQLVRPDAAAQ